MIKQVYKFLSALLISNLIFSPAGICTSQKQADKVTKVVSQNKDNSNKTNNNQKPIGPNLKKMPIRDTNEGRFTTLYGVMNLNDIYRSYPSQNSN